MQGGKRPNKAQQHWQDWQRDQGCYLCGMSAEIHHCVGSTAKHNKVEIGQWFTNQLCNDHHTGDLGIHKLGGWRKLLEKEIFIQMADGYVEQGFSLPDDAYRAIVGYHR